MARTQQQIRDVLENCAVASRSAVAAVVSDAALSPVSEKKHHPAVKGRNEDHRFGTSPSWPKYTDDDASALRYNSFDEDDLVG